MENFTTTTIAAVEVQGERVPARGFGTWQITGRAAAEGVRDALELTDEDRAATDALPKDVRTADPPLAPDWDA